MSCESKVVIIEGRLSVDSVLTCFELLDPKDESVDRKEQPHLMRERQEMQRLEVRRIDGNVSCLVFSPSSTPVEVVGVTKSGTVDSVDAISQSTKQLVLLNCCVFELVVQGDASCTQSSLSQPATSISENGLGFPLQCTFRGCNLHSSQSTYFRIGKM